MPRRLRPIGAAALLIAVIATLAMHLGASTGSAETSIKLTVVPGKAIVGEETRLFVSLGDSQGAPVDDAAVSIACEPPAASGEHAAHGASQHAAMVVTANAQPTGKDGEYQAVVTLSSVGEWKVTVTAGSASQVFWIQAHPMQTKANAVEVSRSLGGYSYTLSAQDRPMVHFNSDLVLTVTDQAGSPASGLNVEAIPVPVPEPPGAHSGMPAGHHHPNAPVDVVSFAETALGRYEASYAFPDSGPFSVLIRTSASGDQLVPIPLTVDMAGSSNGPNYLFVGALLAIVLGTIGVVGYLHLREARISADAQE